MAAVNHISTHKVLFSGSVQTLIEELRVKIANYRLYRQTVNELNALTKRELADLGLNRSMIKRVALQAAYENN